MAVKVFSWEGGEHLGVGDGEELCAQEPPETSQPRTPVVGGGLGGPGEDSFEEAVTDQVEQSVAVADPAVQGLVGHAEASRQAPHGQFVRPGLQRGVDDRFDR